MSDFFPFFSVIGALSLTFLRWVIFFVISLSVAIQSKMEPSKTIQFPWKLKNVVFIVFLILNIYKHVLYGRNSKVGVHFVEFLNYHL